MKTKSLFLAALVVLSSAVVFAGKEEEPRKSGFAIVPVKGSQIFKVVYKGETTGKVKLNIYNADGLLMMSQTFNSVDGFILPVNFAGLASGDYTIELVDAAGKKVEKVSYQTKRNIQHVHISRIVNEENKFLLSVASKGTQSISLKIYDNANNLLHSEVRTIEGDFAQVYKLAKSSEHYTFEITDNAGNIKSVRF